MLGVLTIVLKGILSCSRVDEEVNWATHSGSVDRFEQNDVRELHEACVAGVESC